MTEKTSVTEVKSNSLLGDLNYLLHEKHGRIYGDAIIGYRMQLDDGSFDDESMGVIYEKHGIENPVLWNSVCDKIKHGCHNW